MLDGLHYCFHFFLVFTFFFLSSRSKKMTKKKNRRLHRKVYSPSGKTEREERSPLRSVWTASRFLPFSRPVRFTPFRLRSGSHSGLGRFMFSFLRGFLSVFPVFTFFFLPSRSKKMTKKKNRRLHRKGYSPPGKPEREERSPLRSVWTASRFLPFSRPVRFTPFRLRSGCHSEPGRFMFLSLRGFLSGLWHFLSLSVFLPFFLPFGFLGVLGIFGFSFFSCSSLFSSFSGAKIGNRK